GRREFAGMITRHGAQRVSLDALDRSEAEELLGLHLAAGTVTAQPGAVADLLSHCAGLPLAISIVAARATSRPTFPLSALAGELSMASARLDALSTAELGTNLRAVFGSSYRVLDDAAARAFGLLGLAPTPDVDLAAAAALTGLPPARTRTLLRELEAAHLVA